MAKRIEDYRLHKDAAVSLRVSRAEYNAWDDMATKKGMVLSSWICEQLKQPPLNKPNVKELSSPEFVYNFRMPIGTRQWLKYEAIANGISVSNFIRICCNEGVSNAEKAK